MKIDKFKDRRLRQMQIVFLFYLKIKQVVRAGFSLLSIYPPSSKSEQLSDSLHH